MSEDYTKELHLQQLRDKLNTEKIKLWLSPYTSEDGGKGEIPQDLVSRYAKELNISEEVCSSSLEELRLHALQKLSERKKFQDSGLATLKVKIAGLRGLKDVSKPSVIVLEISLSVRGQELREQISSLINVPTEQLKLICSGHVISNENNLAQQNVKNGSQIMVLQLSVTEAEAAKRQDDMNKLMSTRQAAELLSSKVESDDDNLYDVQIADQSGRPLNLPKEERKALTLAIALHEKGRSALKNKEISQALLLLLEADKEFRKCRSDILNAVDNYAVLCLDIVWCYLCLKNINDLPDADHRLRTSEECFIRSYGSNMERLNAVKGGSSNELVLFVRLHLLQGIVAFHQHKIQQARSLLAKAEEELVRIQVDEDQLTEVMAMGFGEREARFGLRVSGGNIAGAVQHIMKRREEKEQIRKKVKEDRHKRSMQKTLGKTASGDNVNVENYEMLISMGFSKGASAEALRQANNDVSMALEVLGNHPELLSLPDPVQKPPQITDDMIAQLVSMGFDPEMVKKALVKLNGNIQQASEELLQNGGVIFGNVDLSAFMSGASSSGTSDSSPEAGPSNLDQLKMKKEEKEVLDKFVSDIPEDEEDYLDLNLNDESQFLQEYKTIIESLPH